MTVSERIKAGGGLHCFYCRHHVARATGEHADRVVNHVCMEPRVRVNLVTGALSGYGIPCREARAAEGRCGPDGLLFEASE